MPSTSTLRPPQQSRSRKTLDRIVAAALELISEQGVDGATVQEIVRRSGTSVGSFYHRFSSKDDLLRYLEERVWDEATDRWEALWREEAGDDRELEVSLGRAVGALVEAYRADLGVRTALSGVGSPAGSGAGRARAFRDRVRGDLREAILAFRRQISHPDPERGVEVAFRLLLGGLRELGPTPEGDGPDDGFLCDEELTRELSRALAGYLGAGAPGSRAPDEDEGDADARTADPFDIWS